MDLHIPATIVQIIQILVRHSHLNNTMNDDLLLGPPPPAVRADPDIEVL